MGQATSAEPTAQLSYKLITSASNSDAKAFILQGTQIKTAINLDFETRNFYSFQVQVSDVVNGRSNRASVVVRITDINDNQPQWVTTQRQYSVSDKTIPGSTI